jgi:RHS repeat-associated protein
MADSELRILKKLAAARHWDYDGDEIYGDFEMVGGVPNELRSFELGIGKFDWSGGNPLPSSAQFYHGNQIGTTRFMTSWTVIPGDSAVYTAFGERIDGTNHRYGYAGAWGYRSHDDLPFLHVGHRYYDPGTGRFLQRDPVGIRGGANVYLYAGANPLIFVDPNGLDFWGTVGGIFLDVTGGRGRTYLDRVGDNIAGRRLPSQVVIDAVVVGAAARVPKKPGPNRGSFRRITRKGPASTKSIWQTRRVRRITGTTIRGGMRIGFAATCARLVDGAGAIYNIGAAAYEEW